jgi:hypothetical protein
MDRNYIHTDSNFTAAENVKLAVMEDKHFKDSYPSLAALKQMYPSANDEDYAYVGVARTNVTMYIWAVTYFQCVAGFNPARETPASIKTKYEANPDTNGFTDTDSIRVASIGYADDL